MSKYYQSAQDICRAVDKRLRKADISIHDFAGQLNRYLDKDEQKPVTHSRIVTLYRWLNVDSETWPQPRYNTAAAFKAWLENN